MDTANAGSVARPGATETATAAVPDVSNPCMTDGRDDDRVLVDAVLARRPGSFEALVTRHQKLVWHLVYRIVQHPEETRDLSQEVFLKVHQRLHQFRFESALGTWIGRIAFSVASRHMQRKRLPMVEPGEDGTSPLDRVSDDFDLEAACADTELLQHMNAAIEALPPLQRTLITLYHVDELGIADVARIAGLPTGTVKSHLFRARLRLRQHLESLEGCLS
jgi:RNA polymerase sigma-70 factor (ECF subfamily)